MDEQAQAEAADLKLALTSTLAVLDRTDLSDDERLALGSRVAYIRERLRKLGLPGEPGTDHPPITD